MSPKHLAGLAALSFALLTSTAHANLVTNGDFESSSYGYSSQFGDGKTGGQGVTGWVGNTGYNIWFTGGTATTSAARTEYNAGPGVGNEKLYSGPGMTGSGTVGASFVALDGDSGVRGGIKQTIMGLQSGRTYKLEFDWGAGQLQSRTGGTTEQFQVTIDNQTYLTPVVTDPSESFTGWFHQVYTFTATNASTVLSFLSIGTPSGLPPIATLDGVSLNEVPEPMSITLLGAGLAAVGLVRRRRNRNSK